MININLLPYRDARRQRQVQKILAAWAGVGVFAALISLGVHTYMLSEVEDREAIKKENVARIATLDKQLGELKKLEELKAALQKRLDVVAQLNKNRDLPERLLMELSRAIPSKIWLISMEVRPDRVLFGGYSDSNAEIANFMINLGKSPYFSSVELGKSSDQKFEGVMLKSFEMTLGVKPPT